MYIGFYDVRQTEIHTAEALVLELHAFVVEMAIEKLKRHKSPGIYQIPVGQIKAGSRAIPSGIHKLINSMWNKDNCLRSGRSLSLYAFIRRVIKQIVIITEAYLFCQLRTKFYPTSCWEG